MRQNLKKPISYFIAQDIEDSRHQLQSSDISGFLVIICEEKISNA